LERLKAEGGMLDQGQRLLSDTGRTMRNADRSITELKGDISSAISRVDSLTHLVNNFVAAGSEPLLESIALAPTTLERVNTALDSLSLLSSRLNQSAEAMAKGEGSAGKILHEDELYDNLLKSIDNLDHLIADIKANPRKYIKFSIF